MQFKWKYSHLSNIFMDHCRFLFPVLVSNLCMLRRLLKTNSFTAFKKRFFEKERRGKRENHGTFVESKAEKIEIKRHFYQSNSFMYKLERILAVWMKRTWWQCLVMQASIQYHFNFKKSWSSIFDVLCLPWTILYPQTYYSLHPRFCKLLLITSLCNDHLGSIWIQDKGIYEYNNLNTVTKN